MIRVLGTPKRLCDGLTRRELLHAGALSALGGLTLPNLLRAEETANKRRTRRPGKAKSVITLFLLPDINERLKPKLLELKPGTRIASNSFEMGDWEPDARETAAPCTSWCTALFWVVPAKVGGVWQLGDQKLTLTQQYQMVSGTLGSTPITNGRLKGEDITFTVGSQVYTGHVNGERITGRGWTATRTKG